jgi:putative transcriptional regulator
MKPRSLAQFLVLAVLAISAAAAQATDLSKSLILVAKPELTDVLYGSTVIVVTPIGGEQHAGFIVNRPTGVKLGQIFPEDGPSQKVVDPVYLGGPVNPQVIFALVESSRSPGSQSFELMPGLYAAVEADTVDNIIRSEPDRARFVAGLVLWKAGELQQEIERGAWYVLAPDAHLALQPSQGLWEELVRTSNLRANAI